MMKGAALRNLDRYDEAIDCGRVACQYPDADFLPHLHLAASFGRFGRLEEAQTAISKALDRKPDLTIAFMSERYATLHPTMAEPFFDGLRKAGLPE